jgi:S1-C subfamily serine protease
MRQLLAVTFLAALIGCCSVQRTIAPIPVIHRTMDATVGLVEPQIDATYRLFCSGVYISRTIVITAAHCVDEPIDMSEQDKEIAQILGITPNPIGGHIMYATHDEMRAEEIHKAGVATIVAFDETRDLALLEVPLSLSANVSLARENPTVGELVYSVGHTLGLADSMHPGMVSAVRHMRNMHDVEETLLQVSSTAWKGSSGGGLYNVDGELIGICSFLAGPAPNMVFFVSIEEVHAFLDAQTPKG